MTGQPRLRLSQQGMQPGKSFLPLKNKEDCICRSEVVYEQNHHGKTQQGAGPDLIGRTS